MSSEVRDLGWTGSDVLCEVEVAAHFHRDARLAFRRGQREPGSKLTMCDAPSPNSLCPSRVQTGTTSCARGNAHETFKTTSLSCCNRQKDCADNHTIPRAKNVKVPTHKKLGNKVRSNSGAVSVSSGVSVYEGRIFCKVGRGFPQQDSSNTRVPFSGIRRPQKRNVHTQPRQHDFNFLRRRHRVEAMIVRDKTQSGADKKYSCRSCDVQSSAAHPDSARTSKSEPGHLKT